MSSLIGLVTAWLKGQLGGFLGAIASWLVKPVIDYVVNFFRGIWERYLRSIRQKEAKKKIEEDVQQGKPRNEETRKNEEDWLNS